MNFIKSHQYLHAIFREHSLKQLCQLCQTKFATSFMVLERLMEVHQALIETMADRHWETWLHKKREYVVIGKKCSHLVNAISFWKSIERIKEGVEPFVLILQMIDVDAFVLGKIYGKWLMQ